MNANYSNVSMLDMVFEHRNKAYGAYVLRRENNARIQQAMLSILSVLTLFCFGNYIREHIKPKTNEDLKHIIIACPSPIGKIEKVQPVPKPKPPITQPQKAQAIATVANTEKKIVANSRASDSIPTIAQLENVESGIRTNLIASTGLGATDGTGKDEILEAAKEVQPAQPQVYNWTEVMPEYPGGQTALMDFIAKNVGYPDMERENGISGKVTAQFTINEDGTISDVTIVKSPSAGFNRAVKGVIGKLDRFKPGMQQGRAVKVRLVLPVQFTMKP